MTSKILDGLQPLAEPIDLVMSMKGNPRRGDVQRVAASLDQFGQHKPIVVQRSTREILIGNHTWKAAKSLGWTEIAVVWTDDDRETALARSLADNRSADAGTYDNAELAAMVSEVYAADSALLAAAGFATDEADALLALNTAADESDIKPEVKVGAEPEPDFDDEDPDAEEIRVEVVPPKDRQAKQFEPHVGDAGNSHLYVGDCLDVLADFPDNCMDVVITDPIGGLTTDRKDDVNLGSGWLKGVPGPEFWSEIARVMKPGAYCAALGASTTSHRMAVAMEDAGLEIKDTLVWLFAHGMPMGVDAGALVDKFQGGDAEPYMKRVVNMTAQQRADFLAAASNEWYGWSNVLKPGYKPILLFRKKLEGSIANNLTTHGTGAINIDGTRVGDEEREASVSWRDPKGSKAGGHGEARSRVVTGKTNLGRWPANVILDEDVALEMGDHARYFVCAAASKAEKNAGLPIGRTNNHPRPRPVSLARWLVRLLCPPGGVVLDPFCGSGTTGVAATEEGMAFIGIDRNERWITDIAKFRLAEVAERKAKGKKS